ncbi:putative Porin domain superfamily [Helianthus annuus]|nr:putative Porin domain superfamily [Helianthus annuus]
MADSSDSISVDMETIYLGGKVSGPLDSDTKETIIGNALFRLQSDIDDPHTFADLFVSSSDPILLMRACAYYPNYGLGAFGIVPVLQKKRRLWCHWFEIWVIEYITRSHTYAIFMYMGSVSFHLRNFWAIFYNNIFLIGVRDEYPKSAWLVSKLGRLTVGVQFDPKFEKKEDARYRNLKNWNYAIRYGLGTGSPLSPSFNFGLELAQNLQFIVSFYQHVVVQRRVKNPLEDNEVVGITNYIDFGFELQTRIDDEKTSNDIHDSTFRVAASWQANKNILVKTKAGPLGSSFCLAFKSWWKPSFTFSMSVLQLLAMAEDDNGDEEPG